jgi:hypothetical protein
MGTINECPHDGRTTATAKYGFPFLHWLPQRLRVSAEAFLVSVILHPVNFDSCAS